MTSPCLDSVIIYQNQHVELTLKICFFKTYLTDALALHARLSHEKLLLKLAQTRYDIYLLSCCKKLDLVPNGFRL